MAEYFSENMIIEDYPLMVLPKLACAIGLNEAIVVQQLFWLLKNPNNGKTLDGHRYADCIAAQAPKKEEPGLWKPDTRSKAQKLAAVKAPKDFPSEREFDAYVEEMELAFPDYRPELYGELCNRKWRH